MKLQRVSRKDTLIVSKTYTQAISSTHVKGLEVGQYETNLFYNETDWLGLQSPILRQRELAVAFRDLTS